MRNDFRLSVAGVARRYGVSENYVRSRLISPHPNPPRTQGGNEMNNGRGIEAIDLGLGKRPWYKVSESSAREFFEGRLREENEVVELG